MNLCYAYVEIKNIGSEINQRFFFDQSKTNSSAKAGEKYRCCLSASPATRFLKQLEFASKANSGLDCAGEASK